MKATISLHMALSAVLAGGATMAQAQTTRVISEAKAKTQTPDWGTFSTYFASETRRTRDGAAGMATPPAPSTARTDSLPVGRCVNMGNHLESPNEGDWGRKIANDDFAIIAKAGFNTIRLPVRWAGHAALKSPYKIDAPFMARVEHVVRLARGAGLNVILNSHNFDDLHARPAENVDRLAGIWAQVARRFAGQPRDHLWFEIENEPHDKLTNANLIATLSPALAAIRKTNPDRPVIIGGEFWSGIDSLATLDLPEDPNVVPTFHYYEPFDFTHQGATWVKPTPAMGRVYGTDADVERLVRDVVKVRAYIRRTGKTPFMGEFGANGPIPTNQRVTYQRTVRVAFDSVGIGMCAWGFTNTFPLYDSSKKAWVPGMRAAMGLDE
jgi:endoglucanase